MGDKKPKKNSSGNADAHKAKNIKSAANRDAVKPDSSIKKKGSDKK